MIAVRNQKKPSYAEEVLLKIKELDQLTFQLSIPSASRRNYVNELDLNQNDIEMFSEDKIFEFQIYNNLDFKMANNICIQDDL